MKKAYSLSYGPSFGTDDEVREFVNSCKLFATWRRELPAHIFVVSESTADEICKEISENFNDAGIYLLAEINSNCEGRLNARSWSIINEKKLPPKAAPVPKP